MQYFDINENDSRFVLTPIPVSRQHYHDFYKQMIKSFWFSQEVTNLNVDRDHYQTKLTPYEQNAIDFILAFFAASDTIVNINIRKRFRKEIPIMEVGYVYDYITLIENVHAETYSLLLDNIIVDNIKKNTLIDGIVSMPVIKQMIDYMNNCINSNESLAKRLIMMACVEGIFFQGCFCIIYWFSSRGLMPALSQSNMWIARDERDHTTFSLMLYNDIKSEHKLTTDEIYKLFRGALDVAHQFTRAALPTDMADMSAAKMSKYLESIADNLLSMIKLPPMYNARHSFSFLDMLNFPPSVNFFEKRTTEYLRGVSENVNNNFDDIIDV